MFDGKLKNWYENGQLANEGNFKDDKSEAIGKSGYENGQFKEKREYKDGKRID